MRRHWKKWMRQVVWVPATGTALTNDVEDEGRGLETDEGRRLERPAVQLNDNVGLLVA
jgi:hypothetical protein